MMNPEIASDFQLRIESRHSWLTKAKLLLSRNDPRFEFLSELAEREQLGIERIVAWYPEEEIEY